MTPEYVRYQQGQPPQRNRAMLRVM